MMRMVAATPAAYQLTAHFMLNTVLNILLPIIPILGMRILRLKEM